MIQGLLLVLVWCAWHITLPQYSGLSKFKRFSDKLPHDNSIKNTSQTSTHNSAQVTLDMDVYWNKQHLPWHIENSIEELVGCFPCVKHAIWKLHKVWVAESHSPSHAHL